MNEISHALVLNLHQPSANLEHLLNHAEWEAKEILYALDRIPRFLWGHEGRGQSRGRVHLALSGTLLETLADPAFQARVYGTVDCGALLWHLQNRNIIDLLGTGYYHPVLPLVPSADREEHVARWRGIGRHLFWRERFDGFWPPEMGFSMELIPILARYGYRYALVDSHHVEAVTPMSWGELRYRPHVARFGGHEIIVVVRDRELSDAQESGMDYDWFRREVQDRTKFCDFPPLVTTCTDGDNGGWFRNSNPGANFWGAFYETLLARVDETPNLRPAFISEYLDRYGAYGEVRVNTGAWNTGWHSGHGFTQWTGSWAQRQAIERIGEVSEAIHELRWFAGLESVTDPGFWSTIEDAMWRLLRAETSCNIYWGEAWVDRCHVDLDAAVERLELARRIWSPRAPVVPVREDDVCTMAPVVGGSPVLEDCVGLGAHAL
ncbi:MAG: glycoside hydrolase family 57 [Deltaproteobacteria bacterium]|nr:glycoside hydrolase family 57 [Deltaproteobacteria bacterium]